MYKRFCVLLVLLFSATCVFAASPPTLQQSFKQASDFLKKRAPATPDESIWLVIEDIIITDHGTSMSWYAKARNTLARINKDQLEIKAYQLLGNRVLGPAGETMSSGTAFSKNESKTFTRQNWGRIRDARQLKVVIKDKMNGRTVSKIVNIPQAGAPTATQPGGAAAEIANMNSEQFTNPHQEIVVLDATYKGRGAYQVRVQNNGNVGISAKQLEIRPFYYVQNRPAVVGVTATNPSPILAGSSKIINSNGGGIYAFGMPECSMLQKVTIEVKNPGTGQLIERHIPISRPSGKVVDVDLYLSALKYTIKNTGTYTTKFHVRMMTFEILKGKYDHLATVKDLFHTTITLGPGQTDSVYLQREQVNAELKSKLPSLKNKFYGADNYMVELYTEHESDYCPASQIMTVDQASMRRHGGIGAGEEILMSD